MQPISLHLPVRKLLHTALVAGLVALGILNANPPQAALAQGTCPVGVTYPGNEALPSTITLQMPFIAGQTWTVGGAGSFYGNGLHCNGRNDHYATDWNRSDGTASAGSVVLPVADGTVFAPQAPPCPVQEGYGCFVRINHANGYQTLYAHLSQVLVADGNQVRTWTRIGLVGDTGLPPGGGAHLHLAFRHFDNGDYYSHCNTPISSPTTCATGEALAAPQGYRPSPMITTLGRTTLQDGQAYTSVNGRVYLSDLQNTGYYVSVFYVRNNGTEARNIKIYYFYTNGSPTPKVSDVCFLNPRQRCEIRVNELNRIPAGVTGSAFVDGGEDVSVVVTQKHTAPEAWAAYTGVSQVASQVHIPVLHKNNYGLYSEIYVQNPSTVSTNVTIEYKVSPGQLGSSCSATYPNVPARGLLQVYVGALSCVGPTFVGSAFITNTANNPLAVASTQRRSDNSSLLESSSAGGIANLIYAPLIQNNNFGWIAGISLQNASGSANTINSTVYNQGGGVSCRNDAYNVGARVSQIIGVPGSTCTQVASAVYSGGTLPVGAIVNQVLPGTPSSTDYEAIAAPTRVAVVPLWKNQAGSWISGLVVQNTTNQTAVITITYYDASGNQYGSPVSPILQPRAIYVAGATGVPDGSLMVTANQPIAVVTNHALSISGDGGMSHIGINR